jgi:methylphosphotriester-DNA--protein-cysteine methyltransferase
VKTETRSFYEAAVERAVTRIASTLDEALDLEAIARVAALSPFHFHRVFRGMVGETPLEMHRRLRLERAASQLVGGTASITTVSFRPSARADPCRPTLRRGRESTSAPTPPQNDFDSSKGAPP